MPTARPPSAGHHIQCIGRRAEQVLDLVERGRQQPRQRAAQQAGDDAGQRASAGRRGAVCSGNSGAGHRAAAAAAKPATAQAIATGSRLRGRSSNSSSSTASSTAATGVPNTAVMPATAPATSSVLRSAPVRWKYWRDQRADRAAGHDDRAFGAERAAAADRDARRQRLEHARPWATSGSCRTGSPRSPPGCRGRGSCSEP